MRGLRVVALVQMALLAAVCNIAAPGRVLAAEEKPIRLVVFGDSLVAGFMLRRIEAFPAQLEIALTSRGHRVEVVNSGVSGDTTAGGLERFDWAVPEGTDAAILELGANDALRGIDPKVARANLDQILGRLKGKGIATLVAGMSAPRNWGDAYVAEFEAIYPELARAHGAMLYPFFLDGVALRPEMNLGDGLHPNARGVAEIVVRMLPAVEELLATVKARRAVGTPAKG